MRVEACQGGLGAILEGCGGGRLVVGVRGGTVGDRPGGGLGAEVGTVGSTQTEFQEIRKAPGAGGRRVFPDFLRRAVAEMFEVRQGWDQVAGYGRRCDYSGVHVWRRGARVELVAGIAVAAGAGG